MMGGKFELYIESVEPAEPTPGMHAVLRSERCISCGECIRRCIYGVHERSADDPRVMAEPLSHRCRACIVCPQQCPRRALEVVWNPELERVGVPPYDADAVLTLWSEALDGKIPVRGAGYAGPFRGRGFDGIWTDMSEIVRPTRDGIHGREYISTEFDLGRKLPDVSGLRFDAEGRLQDRIPLTRDLPVPVLGGRLPLGPGGLGVAAARARAAMELKTFALMDLAEMRGLRVPVDGDEHDSMAVRYLRENHNHIALRLGDGDFDEDGEPRLGADDAVGEPVLALGDVTSWAAVIELSGHSLVERAARLRERQRDLILVAEVPATPAAPQAVVELARGGIDAIHLACGWRGEWADGSGDETSVVQAIRDSHLALVEAGIRDQLTLMVSGGIARAEHLPKSILLGADAAVIDVPLLVAMGCHVCTDCRDDQPCHRELLGLDPRWGARRVVNMMAAWRNQLLEVLGAMGMREVRRLRGEVGRGLFADDLEGAFFADLVPLIDGDDTLEVEAEDVDCPPAPYTAVERMRNRHGLYLVQRGEDCVSCGTCANGCSRGVLRWPGGLLHPPPTVSEACVGLECGENCVGACPEGALRVVDDDRLQVVDHHRWTHRFIVENWHRAEGLPPVVHGQATTLGRSDGGFDLLRVVPGADPVDPDEVDLSMELNRRDFGPRITLPFPWYGGGMSYGSISDYVMLGRAMAAAETGTFTCTGEGGYPEPLFDYADHVVTQIATGYFGVREETVQCARMVEFKYAQGAKPGLGGHLLGDKNTPTVARLREAVPGTALFSPFPFHSVYSIEDHRKHVDWVRQINPDVLVSVKVSTPGDVDMVAVGSYHAGANVVHLDGAYGGTGAAPEVAKKNIAMPIELALSRTHRFLASEGIRDEVVLIASGGVRGPMDIVKSIALGADGVVIGTADIVAVSCLLCRNCEKDRGCPRGIATTDPGLVEHLDADWCRRRIVNLYRSWESELRWIVARLGLRSVRDLRGRTELLRYLPREGRADR